MPAEDHFITRGLTKVQVDDFLRRELKRAGYAGVDLQKTPLGTRVVIRAARPGMVIGRRGATVRELTETLEEVFGLEDPQIEVNELDKPELNAMVMAERLAQRLERGDHFRRAAYGILRRIMAAGAIGAEISIKGKLTSRRARYQKFKAGYVTKCGEPARTNVSYGTAVAITKPGVLGVQIRIMKPDAVSPDRPVLRELPKREAATKEEGELEIIEEEIPIEEEAAAEEAAPEKGGEEAKAEEAKAEEAKAEEAKAEEAKADEEAKAEEAKAEEAEAPAEEDKGSKGEEAAKTDEKQGEKSEEA